MFYLKLSIDVVKDTSMLIGAINGGVVNLRKKIFLSCAWSIYEEEFKDNLKRLAMHGKQAVEDLLRYPV